MKIPNNIRRELKQPLGKIIKVSDLKRLRRKLIIAVGDVVGKRMVDAGIDPNIWIYDGMEMRRPVKWEIEFPTHTVINPRGFITLPLMRAIDDCVKKGKGRIFVDGEEDLATLYCIAVAPIGTLVVYGQPKRGIVVVSVDKENRKKAVSFIFKSK
ncbi:MAG: DUF359 domain-containing protein [Candidatus Micrarchaeia archaeon]